MTPNGAFAMTENLTQAGYEQTKAKLAKLNERLTRLAHRTDLTPQHLAESRRTYEQMIAQYRLEIKLYEAAR
jgi:hypothetical protein